MACRYWTRRGRFGKVGPRGAGRDGAGALSRARGSCTAPGTRGVARGGAGDMETARVEYQAPQAHTRIDVRGGRTSLASETTTLKVGDLAPDFALPSHLGTTVQLSALRGHHTVLLAFFPL